MRLVQIGIIAGLVLGAWTGRQPCSAADERGPVIRRVLVPAADFLERLKASSGPYRELHALSFEQFRRLERQLHSGRPPAQSRVQRAHYTARLKGRLLNGTAELVVMPEPARPTLLRWAAGPVTVDAAQWGQRLALLGYATAGRFALAVPPAVDRPLSFRWSMALEPDLADYQFTLPFPPAVSSRMILELPTDFVPTSPNSLVTGPSADAGRGYRTWTVRWSLSGPLKLSLHRQRGLAPFEPLITYQRLTEVEVAEEASQLKCSFIIKVWHGPIDHLEFDCPPELRVVDWSGVQVRDWDRSAPGRIRADLSEPLQADRADDPATTITVQLLGPGPKEGRWELPAIAIHNGVWTAGRTRMQGRGLSLHQVKVEPGRIVPDQSSGFPIVAEHYGPDSKLVCRATPLRPEVFARVHTDLAVGSRLQATARVTWQAVEGSPSRLPLRLPTDWMVQQVEGLPDGVQLDRTSSSGRWRPNELQLRIGRSMPKQTAKLTATIKLIGPDMDQAEATTPLPRLVPLDVEVAEETGTLEVEDGWWAELTDVRGCTVAEPGSATAPTSKVSGQVLLHWRFDGAQGAAKLHVRRRPVRFRSRVDTLVAFSRQVMAVDYLLRLQRITGLPDSVELRCIPSPGLPVSWRLPAGCRITKLAEPSEGPGDRWLLRLPAGEVDRIEVRGQWRGPVRRRCQLPLIRVSGGEQAGGLVAVTAPASWRCWADGQGVESVQPPASLPGGVTVGPDQRVHAWRLAEQAAEFQLQVDRSGPPAAWASAAQVTAIVDRDGAVVCRVRYSLVSQVERTVTVRLPPHAVWRRPLAGSSPFRSDDGHRLLVPCRGRDEPTEVSFEYALVPPAGGGLGRWGRVGLLLPYLSVPARKVSVQVYLPQQYAPVSWSGSARLVSPRVSKGWQQRLFGPLARRDGAAMFRFWRPASWHRWWQRVRDRLAESGAAEPVQAGRSSTAAAAASAPRWTPTRQRRRWQFEQMLGADGLTVTVVDEKWLRALAAAIACAVVLLAFAWRTRPGLPRLLLCGLLAGIAFGAALRLPAAVSPLATSLAWSTLGLGLYWWARYRPPQLAGPPSDQAGLSLPSTVSEQSGVMLAVLCLLCLPSPALSQAVSGTERQAPHVVFMPYGEGHWPPERVLVPRATWQLLHAQPVQDQQQQVMVSSASYSAQFLPDRVALTCRFVLESLSETGPALVSVPLSGRGLLLDSALLDDEPYLPQPSVGGIEVELPGKGRHELTVACTVALEPGRDSGLISLVLPEVPSCQVELTVPAELAVESVPPVMNRVERLDGGQRRISGSLPATGLWRLRWQHGQRQEPRLRAVVASLLDLTGGLPRVETRARITVEAGTISQLSFETSPRLLLLSLQAPELASYAHQRNGQRGRIVARFSRSFDSQVPVTLRFLVTDALTGPLQVPALRVIGAAQQSGWLAVQPGPVQTIQVTHDRSASRRSLEEFQAVWPGPMPASPDVQVLHWEQAAPNVLIDRAAKLGGPRFEASTQVAVERQRVQVTMQMTRREPATGTLQHELALPAALVLTDVRTASGSRWQRVAPDRLLWLGTGEENRPATITLRGWLPRRRAQFALPAIHPNPDGRLQGRLLLWRQPGLAVKVKGLRSLSEFAQAPEPAPPAPAGLLLAGQYRIEGPQFSARLHVEPHPARLTASVVTKVTVDREGLGFDWAIDFRVTDGLAESVRLAVPGWLRMPLHLTGELIGPARTFQPGSRPEWTVPLKRPTAEPFSVHLRGQWQADWREGLDIPLIRPVDADSASYAILVVNRSGQRVAVDRPPHFRPSDLASVPARFGDVGGQVVAALESSQPSGRLVLRAARPAAATSTVREPLERRPETPPAGTAPGGPAPAERRQPAGIAVTSLTVALAMMLLAAVFLMLAYARNLLRPVLAPLLLAAAGLFWCWQLQPEPVGPALLLVALTAAAARLLRRRTGRPTVAAHGQSPG